MIEFFRMASPLERVRIVAFAAFLFLCAALGGASRGDVLTHIPVRLAAVVVLVVSAMQVRLGQLRGDRFLLGFLAAAALLMLGQLVPLPPEIWTALPGRGTYLEVAQATQTADVWRPISLTPDLTLDSLLSLLPPLAAIVGVTALPVSFRYSLLPVLIAIVLANALLGIAQVSQGGHGGPYLYDITNMGYPVGFFSNRNHLALLMAAAIPMLALWAVAPSPNRRQQNLRFWLSAAGATALVPLILVAGSRAGLVLAVLGALGAILLIRGHAENLPWTRAGEGRKLIKYLVIAPAILLAGVTLFLARAESVNRFFTVDVTLDQRYTFLPQIWQMVKDFFPFGSGFGSFDSVFRMYEPEVGLTPLYFNHAHNDLLEIFIEGGLPSLLLLVVFLFWFTRQCIEAWRTGRGRPDSDYARLGSIVVAMAICASITDYPLRTPMLAVVMVIALSWMRPGSASPFRAANQTDTPFNSTSVTRHRPN